MHEVLVNRLGGLSLPRKSVLRLTDRPNMTLDVYRGRKTTIQQQQQQLTLQRQSVTLSTLLVLAWSSKSLSFYVKVFQVMGKVLTGKLSCLRTGLVFFPCPLNFISVYI